MYTHIYTSIHITKWIAHNRGGERQRTFNFYPDWIPCDLSRSHKSERGEHAV